MGGGRWAVGGVCVRTEWAECVCARTVWTVKRRVTEWVVVEIVRGGVRGCACAHGAHGRSGPDPGGGTRLIANM